MHYLSGLKIRTKIALLIVISVFLALVGTGGYLYYSQSKTLESNIAHLLRSVGTTTANSMDRFLMARGPELDLVSGSSTLRKTPDDAAYGLSRYLDTFTDFDSLTFTDPSGNIVASQGDFIATQGEQTLKDGVDRWYPSAMDGQRLLGVIAEPGNFSRYLVYITPVIHEGRNYGWLFAQVDNETLVEQSTSVEIGATGRASLFNAQGRLIGHQDKSRYGDDMSDYSIMQAPLERDVGNTGETFTSSDGREKWGLTVLFPKTLEKYGVKMGLIVDQTTDEMYAPIYQIRNSTFIAILLCLLLFAPAGVYIANRIISRPLKQVSDSMKAIASGAGDLRQRLPDNGKDELGELCGHFNAFASRMQQILVQVRDSAHAVSQEADQISRDSERLASSSEQTAANLQQTSSSTEEISSTAQHSTASSEQANKLAQNAASIASEGRESMQKVEATMDELNASSQKISEIIKIIDGIAFQTNILALNASVEAARAGEHGRGFAVVAEEVRNLASRSSNAAHDIHDLINTSVKGTQAGSKLVNESSKTMDEIYQSITKVSDVIAEITASIREQSTGISQINTAVNELDTVTQENASMVQHFSHIAGNMLNHANDLQAIVDTFQLDEGQTSLPRQKSATSLQRPQTNKQTVQEKDQDDWASF